MLVLSRKTGEEIQIGDEIIVKITHIQGGRVRIGIEAPKHISITRSDSESIPVRSKAGSKYSSALR